MCSAAPGEVTSTAEVGKAVADVAVKQIKEEVEQTIVKVAQDITRQNQASQLNQRYVALSALEAQNGPGLYIIAAVGVIIFCMLIYVAYSLRGMRVDMGYEDQGVEQILHMKTGNPRKKNQVHPSSNGLAPPPRHGDYNGSGTDCSMVDVDI